MPRGARTWGDGRWASREAACIRRVRGAGRGTATSPGRSTWMRSCKRRYRNESPAIRAAIGSSRSFGQPMRAYCCPVCRGMARHEPGAARVLAEGRPGIGTGSRACGTGERWEADTILA